MHVLLSSNNEQEFRLARGLVEDLVKAVVESGSDALYPNNVEALLTAKSEIRIVMLSDLPSRPTPSKSASSTPTPIGSPTSTQAAVGKASSAFVNLFGALAAAKARQNQS